MVSFGGLAAITALPAFALTTGSYSIGAPSGGVVSPAVTPAVATVGDETSFAVTFTTTAALASTNSVTVTPSVALGSVPTGVDIVDDSASTCLQSGSDGGAVTASAVTVVLDSTCSVAAGNKVEVDFTALPAVGSTSLSFGITTSSNATSESTNTITVTSTPPTVSVGTSSFGNSTTYTIAGVDGSGAAHPWSGDTAFASATQLELTATNTIGGPALADEVTWYPGGAGGYTVTYTPSGGVATADTVESASVQTGATNEVVLDLGTAIPSGDTVTITALGTNPAVSNSDTVTISPGIAANGVFTLTPEPVTGASPVETTTNTVVYGTSPSAVTVSPSPLVASASATYVATFKATSAVPDTGDIILTETTGPTNFSSETGVLVTDSTAGWHFVATGVLAGTSDATPTTLNGSCTVGVACTSAGALLIPLTGTGDAIAAADLVTVTVAGVTNPANATYSDFDVETSGDTVAAAAPAYVIGPSGSAGVTVTPVPATASTTATYTVTNLYANSSGIAAGGLISLTATSGTVFPDAASYYTIADSTTASGSGTATAVTSYTGNGITFAVPNTITAGDLLTLTVGDVVNPSTGSYTLTILGNVSGPSAVAPFPDANVTYPNGSLVNFGGTIWLFAGGHPFGIATETLLAKIQSVDKSAILKATTGSILPVAAPHPGTLITTYTVNGNDTIYVVGTDGELHGFASSSQYLSAGYDSALAITVPSLDGLTVGSTVGVLGTAGTALATSANGAIVDSAGTYYVFDGGKAFGIPTTTALAIVKHADTAETLTGTVVSTQTGASIATGTLLTVAGEVYVAYVGNLFGFKSWSQLVADGYAGTASVTVTNLGGLSVVTGYTGS